MPTHRVFPALCSAIVICLWSASAGRAAIITDGLQVHLDASTITGVADGAEFGSWNDQSGNGRHATAAGAAQPSYVAAGIGGLPAVRFDGTNDGLGSVFVGNTFIPTGNSFFIIFRSTQTTQGTFISLNPSGSGVNQGFAFINRFDSAGSLLATFDTASGNNNNTQDLSSGSNNGAGHLFTAVGGGGASTPVTLRADGGLFTNTFTETPQLTAVDAYSVGVLNDLATTRFSGDIAEILVYNRTLTPAEIAQNESTLLAKYSIPEPSVVALGALAMPFFMARRRRRHAR